MKYNAILSDLTAASSVDDITKLVVDTCESQLEEQGELQTTNILRFMHYHTSPIEVRVEGLLKHLDVLRHAKDVDDKSLGVTAVWKSVDNSTQSVHHLLIGIPHKYGIWFSVLTDKLKNEKHVHGAIGVFPIPSRSLMGDGNDNKVERFSTFKGINKMISYLNKITEYKPATQLKNTMPSTLRSVGWAPEQYEAKWGEGGVFRRNDAAYKADNFTRDVAEKTANE